MSDIANKWDAIYAPQSCEEAQAAEVLQRNKHLLPKQGKVLDLACGLGGNAILLAKLGFEVEAWDISNVAIDKIKHYAQTHDLNISAKIIDVEINPPTANTYEVVVVSCFLDRALLKHIFASVKPGGLLFYQTFTSNKVSSIGPSNPDYLLNENELLDACANMQVLVYREEAMQGDTTQGWRNQAMIVAKQVC